MSKIWAIVRRDGVVSNVTVAETPLPATGGDWVDITDVTPRPWVDWVYADGVFTPPAAPLAPTPVPQPTISKVRFEAVFASAVGDLMYETVLDAIAQVAATNPMTEQSAQVKRAKRALDDASDIAYPVTDWRTAGSQGMAEDLTAEFLKIVNDILVASIPDIGDKIDAGLAAWPKI